MSAETEHHLKPHGEVSRVLGHIDLKNDTDVPLRVKVKAYDTATGLRFEVTIREPDAYKAPEKVVSVHE